MSIHHVRCHQRRFTQLRPGLRQTVLTWILLCQFPLPLVHAHAALDPRASRLAAHLREHHADQPGKLAHHGLHWHLISPWDGTSGDDPPETETSPIGLWGAKGPAILHPVQASLLDAPGETLLPRHDEDRLPRYIVTSSACDAYPSGFVQTYSGIPLCALLGIALR